MSQPSPLPGHLALPTFGGVPHGLALPSSTSSPSVASPAGAGSPNVAAGPKRKRPAGGRSRVRKRAENAQRNLADTELNEADDVDDSELIAGPDRSAGREGDGDGDAGEEEEDGDEGDNEDGNEEDEADQPEGGEGRGGGGDANAGAASTSPTAGGIGTNGGAVRPGMDGAASGVAGAGGLARRAVNTVDDVSGAVFRPGQKGEQLYDEEQVKKRSDQQKNLANMVSQVIGPEEAKRFEAFAQAALNRQSIRKLVTAKHDQPLNDIVLKSLAGLGKVFVTEAIEIAKEIQEHSDHPTGPLRPYHLQMARQIMIDRGILGSSGAQGAARRGNPLR